MAQCCQSIQLPPIPLPESLVYGLQKKERKGSIIFYRSSPVALTRERRISITRVEDVVSDVCQVYIHLCVQLASHSSKFRSFLREMTSRKEAALRLLVVS